MQHSAAQKKKIKPVERKCWELQALKKACKKTVLKGLGSLKSSEGKSVMGADCFHVNEGSAKVYCLLSFKTVMGVPEAAGGPGLGEEGH